MWVSPFGSNRLRCAILRLLKESTRKLWNQQDRHTGDRMRLMAAVYSFVGDTPILYPGSFVDIAPSSAYLFRKTD